MFITIGRRAVAALVALGLLGVGLAADAFAVRSTGLRIKSAADNAAVNCVTCSPGASQAVLDVPGGYELFDLDTGRVTFSGAGAGLLADGATISAANGVTTVAASRWTIVRPDGSRVAVRVDVATGNLVLSSR